VQAPGQAVAEPAPLAVLADGTRIAGEQAGEGPAVLLLHGLTATRRYVVMGSRMLERSGRHVIAYDARGHGASDAPRDGAYDYPRLAADAIAVLDACGVRRAVLAGASMGAHTALALALAHPDRVAGLVLITPAYDPERSLDADVLARWDALADGLQRGGVEGFVAAYDLAALPPAWRASTETVLRQRMSLHAHPEAVVAALREVPRSRPFPSFADLARISAPTLVVASRDEADPTHPLATAERYADAIAGAELRVEERAASGEPARSPLAWQGGQLSRAIAELAERAELRS
jgi:pimeloyl-ACP methyl ester carboxylesterase